jgi:hypothetical protein
MHPRAVSEWWLDWSALPDRLLWAYLTVLADGAAEVLDCDGVKHSFPHERAARSWLAEDEYSPLQDLIETGDIEPDVRPPETQADKDMVRHMSVRRKGP